MAGAINNRTDRLDVRVPAELKQLIEEAASVTGQSLSEFVLGVTVPRARKIVREHKIIRLSDRDRDTFLAALKRTESRPMPGLIKAAARHKRVIG